MQMLSPERAIVGTDQVVMLDDFVLYGLNEAWRTRDNCRSPALAVERVAIVPEERMGANHYCPVISRTELVG